MLRRPERHRSEDRHEHEQAQDKRARVAHFEVLERFLVDHQRQQVCDLQRAAAGDHVRAVEFLERLDHLHDEVEEDHRRQQWQGDPPEHLPGARAIEARGFVEIRGDALQAGEKDHHRRAELPQAQQHDGRTSRTQARRAS